MGTISLYVALRYVKWLGNFATGDLGESIRFKGPVARM
jgi:ABC-type dipeptide/oligopeptide/nickel transport system permease component